MDGEMQSDNAVAPVGGSSRNGICGGVSTLVKDAAVPSIAVAGSDSLYTLCGCARAHIYGYTYRIAGTTVRGANHGVDGGVGRRYGDGIGLAAVGPDVTDSALRGEGGALAGQYGSVACDSHHRFGFDGEYKGVPQGATIVVGVVECVGAALSVDDSVPSVTSTASNHGVFISRVVDDEVQGEDTVTPVGGTVGDGVGDIGAFIVSLSVAGGPSVAVAGRDGLLVLSGETSADVYCNTGWCTGAAA